MSNLFVSSIALALALSTGILTAADSMTQAGQKVGFQADVEKYVLSDTTNPPPKKAILFIGSSIFRLWKQLPEQMAPLPVFNRAFGGSRTWEMLHYMDRLVFAYEPRVIVYYCGSNDINGNDSAENIAARFIEFSRRTAAKLPETRIIYAAICRAPQKRDRWDVVNEANRRVEAYCRTEPRRTFVDVNVAIFDSQGEPRMDLYLPDNLHYKDAAYVEFARVIKPAVEQAWKESLKLGEKTGR